MFILPGLLINSEIPFAACLSTLSANLNDSLTVVLGSIISSKTSLGITNKVSQLFFNSFIPSKALFILTGPSNLKGLVIIPTVKEPFSLAILAISGAAPVPVPPPIPAAINTISADLIVFAMTSLFSSIAFFPVEGSAPAPRPFVSSLPI